MQSTACKIHPVAASNALLTIADHGKIFAERETKGISQNATFNDHGRLLTSVFENVVANLRDSFTATMVRRR